MPSSRQIAPTAATVEQLATLIVKCPSAPFGPKLEGATLESLNAAGEEIHGAIAGVYWSMVVGGL